MSTAEKLWLKTQSLPEQAQETLLHIAEEMAQKYPSTASNALILREAASRAWQTCRLGRRLACTDQGGRMNIHDPRKTTYCLGAGWFSLLSLCVLLLTEQRMQAQAGPRFVVIPSAAETAEGNATVGFGSSGAQFVLQYLYRQADITGLQPGDIITGLTLRLDGSKIESWPTKDVTWEAFNIKISPGVSELGPTLADNFTATPTIARSGPLDMPAGSFPAPEETPRPFGMIIPFTTPHTYTGGDLLFEFRTITPDEVNFSNDAADPEQTSGQGVFASGIEATTAGEPFFLNWVIQLQVGEIAVLRFKPVSRDASGQLVIGWTGTGVLEQSDAVTGPWSQAPNQNNPQTVTTMGGARFFRLKK